MKGTALLLLLEVNKHSITNIKLPRTTIVQVKHSRIS